MNYIHTSEDRTPFTYLIGWKNLNKWYYGVRYAKNCHPNDLFDTYFTSSKYVKLLIESHGIPDSISVRKTFNTIDAARKWEHRVLKKLDVIHSEKWINEHNGTSPSVEFAIIGAMKSKNKSKWKIDDPRRENLRKIAITSKIIDRINSEDQRKKSKETNINRLSKLSKEEKNKLTTAMNCKDVQELAYKTRIDNYNSLSQEEKNDIRLQKSQTTKELHKSGVYDNAYTPERNEKIRKSKLTEEGNQSFRGKISCPNCGKVGQFASMKRWHFENCRCVV